MDKRTLLTLAVVALVGLHGVAGTAVADRNVTVSAAEIAAEGGSTTETLSYTFTPGAGQTQASVRGSMSSGGVQFSFQGWEDLGDGTTGSSTSWNVSDGNEYRVVYEATVPEGAGTANVRTGPTNRPEGVALQVQVTEPQFGPVGTQQSELVFESRNQGTTSIDVNVPNDGNGVMIPSDVTFGGVPDGFTVDYANLPGEIQPQSTGTVTIDVTADGSVDPGTYSFTATVEDNLGNALDVPVAVEVRRPPVLEAGDGGTVDLGDVLVGGDETVTFDVSEVGGYTGIDGVDAQVTQSDQFASVNFDGLGSLSTSAGGSSTAEVTVSVDGSADQHSTIGLSAYLEPENGDGVGQSVTFTGRVIFPPRFGDVTMPDASLVFDEPASEVDAHTTTVTVEVPNEGDLAMNVQGASASTDSGQVSASVVNYDGQIAGQSSGEVTVEVAAPPDAPEGSYGLSVDVVSEEDGTETVTSNVEITHEVELAVERTSLSFGDVIITENLTQSTDVSETLEYRDVEGLTVTRVSGPDRWLTVVERPPEQLTAGEAAPLVVAVQFDTDAELYREYTWEFRVEGEDVEPRTVTVTATPEPVSLEDIRNPLEEYANAGGWQAETASGMLEALNTLESRLREGGNVSRTDLTTGIAAGRATILFIQSVENATGTLESEGNEAAQPEVVKAAATYNLVDSYVSNFESDDLQSAAAESRSAAADRVNSLVDQQRSYYEDRLAAENVTMIERAHINRQLAQLASLQGNEDRAERLRSRSAAAFDNYTATVQRGNELRQSARETREQLRESTLTVVFGQPLMLNPAKWDAFETRTSEALAAYDDAETSFATAGASEEADDVADERSEAASSFQFARYTMYGSTAAYALVFLGLLGYLVRNTYAYVRDAREAVSGDFLVAS